MMECFADLHIHIGQAKNHPVKITASRRLSLDNIYDYCINKKGIDIVGIVDCASPFVIEEIQEQLNNEKIVPLPGGGVRFKDKLSIIFGAEIETTEPNGVAHSIAFFPFFNQIKDFSLIMSKYIANINLSSQKARLCAKELLNIVKTLGGVLIPAHVFTPFKSFYGNCYDRLSYAFEDELDNIFSVELGLSADTDFADTISELRTKSYLSNSDAHSLEKIGREYNKLKLKFPDFENVISALKGVNGNFIVANYGLDPKLGKYHRTFCPTCKYVAHDILPVTKCPICNSKEVTLGVYDRIAIIADCKTPIHPEGRPQYYYQVPLEFIPGVGKKTMEKLIFEFETEMNVIHNVDKAELIDVVGEKVAVNIILARDGKLSIKVGGGGIYGKVLD